PVPRTPDPLSAHPPHARYRPRFHCCKDCTGEPATAAAPDDPALTSSHGGGSSPSLHTPVVCHRALLLGRRRSLTSPPHAQSVAASDAISPSVPDASRRTRIPRAVPSVALCSAP